MNSDKLSKINGRLSSTPLAFVNSFGCQQNQSDGERIKGILSLCGYEMTDTPDNADIIIFNTCAVRESAEERVFGCIGELKHLKAAKPSLIIGICGCMAQEKQTAKRIRESYRYVDLVFGTFALDRLPEMIIEVMENHRAVTDIAENQGYIPQSERIIRDSGFKASVPIMYGCDNFCSYCIVPYVRGRERSRASEDVLAEIRGLAESGCKEIMLLGQNVNSYGKGLDEKISFPELLWKINEIGGDFRVRFMSSHPKDATKELIDAIIGCGKVCKHLHLPLQSGSDRILHEMNRKYTAGKYLETVEYARGKMPDFSFSTDIIVGFPNETEEDFDCTLDILGKVGFDNVFSFIYSKRGGTRAAQIDDKVSYGEKTERMNRMLEFQREIATERYKRFIGRKMNVLVESRGRKSGRLTGKTDEFIIAELDGGDDSLIGRFAEIEVTDAYNWAVAGKII